MSFAASSLLFTLLIPGTLTSPASLPQVLVPQAAIERTAAPASVGPRLFTDATMPAPVPAPALRGDVVRRRPAALSGLYVSFGALQVLDAVSTRRAVARGGTELNPVMQPVAGNLTAMLAVKGVSSAAAIWCAEKAFKRNRKAAVVLMAVLNGVTAAVVANNVKNAR